MDVLTGLGLPTSMATPTGCPQTPSWRPSGLGEQCLEADQPSVVSGVMIGPVTVAQQFPWRYLVAWMCLLDLVSQHPWQLPLAVPKLHLGVLPGLGSSAWRLINHPYCLYCKFNRSPFPNSFLGGTWWHGCAYWTWSPNLHGNSHWLSPNSILASSRAWGAVPGG